jgi:hypothetical protein
MVDALFCSYPSLLFFGGCDGPFDAIDVSVKKGHSLRSLEMNGYMNNEEFLTLL